MKSQSVMDVANQEITTARRKRVQFIGHLLVADCNAMHYRTATNVRHTGAGTSTPSPVGVSLPVDASIRNTTMFPDSWFAASRNLPAGSIGKLRAVFPIVGNSPISLSGPLTRSIANPVTLSTPARFEPLTNLRERRTTCSA